MRANTVDWERQFVLKRSQVAFLAGVQVFWEKNNWFNYTKLIFVHTILF
ncbi:hypothetical protein BLGI_3065 [Brevibacillus laterosporus GI-9]|nr:hypothetical protein BLGI_3065 [Brevibacillus laterosporus GI-9]